MLHHDINELNIENLKKSKLSYPDFYAFSNDNDFYSSLKILGNLQSAKKKNKDVTNVGVLVGESNFVSMAPDLRKHIDNILFCDIDQRQLRHVEFLITCVKTHENKEKFLLAYLDSTQNPAFEGYRDFVLQKNKELKEIKRLSDEEIEEILIEQFDLSILDLKEKHFLSSEERYLECRNAIKETNQFFLTINLFDIEQVKKLDALFLTHKIHVSLVNITNLYEWDADEPLPLLSNRKDKNDEPKKFNDESKKFKYLGNLKSFISFFVNKNTIVLYSLRITTQYPHSRICKGSAFYFQENEVAAREYMDNQFSSERYFLKYTEHYQYDDYEESSKTKDTLTFCLKGKKYSLDTTKKKLFVYPGTTDYLVIRRDVGSNELSKVLDYVETKDIEFAEKIKKISSEGWNKTEEIMKGSFSASSEQFSFSRKGKTYFINKLDKTENFVLTSNGKIKTSMDGDTLNKVEKFMKKNFPKYFLFFEKALSPKIPTENMKNQSNKKSI